MLTAFLIFGAVMLMLALFLSIPEPPSMVQKAYTTSDFKTPDFSEARPIPKLYGTNIVSGNIMYFGGVRAKSFEYCPETSGGGK